MKRLWFPLTILALLTALALGNGAVVDGYVKTWISGTEQAEEAALAEDWETAQGALESVYRQWDQRQTFLHIVETHDALNETECSLQRAMACAQLQDKEEFLCEVRTLRSQFRLLAEMELVNIRNIL